MKKIAINGFGRIGKLAYRIIFGSSDYEVVAINSHSAPEDIAYMLKYDTVHKTMFEYDIKVLEDGIEVDGKFTKVLQIDDPKEYPWRSMGIDLVLDCTGKFTKDSEAVKHIEAGAKHVLISAPGQGNMKTIVYGVNDNILTKEDKIVSAASCTTNCLAPVLDLLDKFIGIESGYMTTIHAYTNDQNTVDGSHKKGIYSRRGRSAAENIIPASTGAASAIGLVLPNLNGKLDGSAFRVPVFDGSCIDLSLILRRETSIDEINALFKVYRNEVLEFTMDPVVSSDIIGTNYGALVDGRLTNVLESDKRVVKVVAWYDNEYGYTSQMIRTMDKWLKL